MANLFEFFKRKKSEEKAAAQETPGFEELCAALPEDLQEEFRELVKELSGEEGMPMKRIEGNYDDLAPEQRRFNDLLGMASKEYYGVGGEE